MDRNETARELIALGKSDAKATARLQRALDKAQDASATIEHNRQRRCELLQEAACAPDSGLDPDIAPSAVEPKEGP